MEELDEIDKVVKESFYNICKYYKISSDILMQFLMQRQKKTTKNEVK